jgi:dipeptidyl aminopeptidase/acylaminoacyl peptidase
MITAQDLTRLALVGAPSAGGGRLVASVQTVDAATLRYRSRLWQFAPTGDPTLGPAWTPTPITDDGPWSDTSPCVGPDGQVAFISDRDGAKRVWLAGSGPLADLGARPTALAWFDDHLVVLAERAAAQRDGAPIVIDWLRYKSDGAGGPLQPTGELWLLSLDGTSRLLASADERWRCLAVRDDFAYYVADPRHGDEPEPGSQVRRRNLRTGSTEDLWDCPSPVQALALTDSGRPLAVASGVPGQSAVAPRVWLVSERRPAFPAWELECERAVLSDCRPLGTPRLLATIGEQVAFLATVGDEVAVFAAEPDSEPRRVSPRGMSVSDFCVMNESVVLCLESAVAPTELYLDRQRISALNAEWVASAGPIAPEPVTVAAADGQELPGLLYRSPSADGRLLVRVHGGPHLSFGNTFDLETQSQLYAGYSVLMPNIRGSAGRGAAFRAASVGEWGRGDYTDLMAFADWAVAAGAGSDLFLAGGSYGGYLINWALTRTDRFRAAVSERSVTNLLSKYGTSDNGFTVNRFEFGGLDLFDEGALQLWDRSPLAHAAEIKTPLLLIHGEADQRCPIEQSEQLFVALRRLGRDVAFARLPEESHGYTATGRPDRRIARLELILTWLATH